MSPAYDFEEDNLLTSLLNDPSGCKEILNLGESTEFKDDDPLAEDSLQPAGPSPAYRDLLDVPAPQLRRKSRTASCPAIPIRSTEMSPFFYSRPPGGAPSTRSPPGRSRGLTSWPTRRRTGRPR